MNKIEKFIFNELAEVRVVVIDGEPWFVASDIAKALGYSTAPAMVRSLDEDEKGMQTVHTPGGDQQLSVISESGLYGAILRSRRPEAKEFRRWVTKAVLPSIRRNGGHIEDTLHEGQERALIRQIAKAGRVEFTDVLKLVYDARPSSTPFRIWAANYTKMMTKTQLGITEQEFKERKAAAGGNFRDAATERELLLLEAAEAHVRLLALSRQYDDIKALYHEAKASIEALVA